jgi:hypothetical protein
MEGSYLKNDKLDRGKFLINLMNVIESWYDEDKYESNHENNSITVSVNSSWGTGKTYLFNMWKELLEYSGKDDAGPDFKTDILKDKKYSVASYSAWDFDDYNCAFTSLIYSLSKMDVYGESENNIKEIKKKGIAFAKNFGISLVKDGVKKLIGENSSEFLLKAVDEVLCGAMSAESEDSFKAIDTYIKIKKKFREDLISLIPEGGKLIIFIDELDRCKPSFAIETLEVVKHYFNIKNVVFAFAVDLEQLAHSIATAYGQNMDSAGYLLRFFDFNVNVPAPDYHNYIESCIGSFLDKQGIRIPYHNVLAVASTLKLSLRDINKIMHYYKVFFLYHKRKFQSVFDKKKYESTLIIFLYFIALKYKYPDIYRRVLSGSYSYNENVSNVSYPSLSFVKFVGVDAVVGLLNAGAKGIMGRKGQKVVGDFLSCGGSMDYMSGGEYIEKMIEMVM